MMPRRPGPFVVALTLMLSQGEYDRLCAVAEFLDEPPVECAASFLREVIDRCQQPDNDEAGAVTNFGDGV